MICAKPSSGLSMAFDRYPIADSCDLGFISRQSRMTILHCHQRRTLCQRPSRCRRASSLLLTRRRQELRTTRLTMCTCFQRSRERRLFQNTTYLPIKQISFASIWRSSGSICTSPHLRTRQSREVQILLWLSMCLWVDLRRSPKMIVNFRRRLRTYNYKQRNGSKTSLQPSRLSTMGCLADLGRDGRGCMYRR